MTDQPVCSFCGRAQDDARKVITGPGVFICNACESLYVHTFEQAGIPLPPVVETSKRQIRNRYRVTSSVVMPQAPDDNS